MTMLLGILVGWLLGNVKPPHALRLLSPGFWKSVRWHARFRVNAARCAAGDHVEHTTDDVRPYNNRARGWCSACERSYYLEDYKPARRTRRREILEGIRYGGVELLEQLAAGR